MVQHIQDDKAVHKATRIAGFKHTTSEKNHLLSSPPLFAIYANTSSFESAFSTCIHFKKKPQAEIENSHLRNTFALVIKW
jgi:hypothetical protein